MSLWIAIPFILLAALCQATFLPLVNVLGYKIDFALVLVVAWGLLGKAGEAAVWGFVAGIFLDLTSGIPFGSHTIALTGIGLLMQFAQGNSIRDNFLLPPAAIIGATFAYHLFLLFILTLLNPSVALSDYLLRITLPSAILNTLAMPMAYFPFQWLAARRV
jgi:rod shape-determining protein MreD